MIPEQYDCNNKKMVDCEFYMHRDCPETCAYAISIEPFNKKQQRLERKNELENL